MVDWLSRVGSLGILSFVTVGFLQGWIVPGKSSRADVDACRKEIDRIRAERDRALELVYKQAELTQRAIEVSAEKVKSS